MRPHNRIHVFASIAFLIFVSCAPLPADEPNTAADSPKAEATDQAKAEPVVVPADKENFHLFLLVGQSNMAGRGTVEAEDTVVHSNILSLNQDHQWEHAVDPLHFDKPKMAGVGLGRTFALDYAAKHPDVTVGLIPCAVGGSPIRAWEPGGFHDQTKSHPYDDAVQRAHVALKSGTLKGILWHQGESDSTTKQSVLYEEKLHALINRFRTELDGPEVPFVAGQLGQFPEKPWNDSRRLVNSVLESLPAKVPFCGFAKSDGLKHKGDETHFNSAAYREFGHRYFQAFESACTNPTR